jgi:hypothetical protein
MDEELQRSDQKKASGGLADPSGLHQSVPFKHFKVFTAHSTQQNYQQNHAPL